MGLSSFLSSFLSFFLSSFLLLLFLLLLLLLFLRLLLLRLLLLLLLLLLFLICSLFILHFPFGVYSLSHPDNALEVCGFVTPLHIVPEWYFLCQYAMLKAVPNKNAGFIVLCTSICIFFLFGEVRNLTSLTRSVHNNNGFSISFFYLSVLCILWIGAQFPQEKFLSYGRILTCYYYFILTH